MVNTLESIPLILEGLIPPEAHKVSLALAQAALILIVSICLRIKVK